MLYRLFILPIEYLIEVVFTIMNGFFGHEGYAIIAVSMTISTLVLPLYLRADAIQEAEQKKQKAMERWIGHIKKTFTGDERYMMTNAYYAEMGYKPLYALKGLIPLLLQIPFFIAAYHFLSNLKCLQGTSFWLIADLGAEDGMLKIGSLAINVLPVLMTGINLISSVIYTKDATLKQKIQPVVLALVFLVLLYHSPAGLVLYWTMNNLYSMCKNVVMKIVKHPERLGMIGPVVIAALFLVFLVVTGKLQERIAWKDHESLFLYGLILLALLVSPAKALLEKAGIFGKRRKQNREQAANGKNVHVTVLLLELALALLLGLVIPLLVLSVAPMDFLVIDRTTDPLHYAYAAFAVACGVFLVWGSLIYGMAEEKGRFAYGRVLLILLFVALVNMLGFKAVVGNVSTMLEFEKMPHFDLIPKAVNLAALAVAAIVGWLLWDKGGKVRDGLAAVVCLTFAAMAVMNIQTTKAGIHDVDDGAEVDYVLPLSKEGRNVIVLMMDRAISAYVPFLFEEKPELYDMYAGFTYYPNTLSFGRGTGSGGPALYGGYEYTTEHLPVEDEDRHQKHIEALLVQPILFGENGFQVTATDPGFWAASATDYSIYDPYPYISAYSLEQNLPVGYDLEGMKAARERNFFFYSIYRIAPAMLQDEIYGKGRFLAADHTSFVGEGEFRRGYTVLKNLPELTRIEEGDTDHFLAIGNNTTHAESMLALPEYTDEREADYTGIDIAADKHAGDLTLHFDRDNEGLSVGHYHSNMAAFLKLGAWFDYLREQGVYDNTRIIIVSDHGYGLPQREDMLLPGGVNVEAVNPVLLVKDFDSNGEFTVDTQFMTNADTTVLATQGIIADPVNPFTGKAITMEPKEGGVDFMWQPLEWDFYGDPYAGDKWYHVSDDILDPDKWVPIEALR
ncbi:MAG: membrane protein insertase YidC [Lachnospiraceae bacterium]|nr:membrane protein insertase YidC [Lachnospiraceae bacterium]